MMALVDDPPEHRMLKAAAQDLQAVDWLDRAGVGTVDKPLMVRHFGVRQPRSDELPCLSLEWTGSTDQDQQQQYKSAGQRQKIMGLRLQVDIAPGEDVYDVNNPNAGDDPTRWLRHLRVVAVALMALRDEAGALRQLATWITDVDKAPDEDSKPDIGRLVMQSDVVYLVSTTDPNRLFAPGENG